MSNTNTISVHELVGYLPYGLVVHSKYRNSQFKLTTNNFKDVVHSARRGDIFPLVRPLSSMTEEEINEIYRLIKECKSTTEIGVTIVQFYYKNHLDIHNWLGRGLAKIKK